MYKFFLQRMVPPRSTLSTILLTMKLTTVLLMVVNLHIFANSYAQRITLSERSASLEEIFDRISDQSGYNFIFTTSVLRNAQPVSIQVSNKPLKEVLDQLFQGQQLEYEIVKKSVVISRKEKRTATEEALVATQMTIQGTVVDEQKKAIASATIKVKQTGQSTQSDANGRFTIPIPQDGALLTISFVGYQTREIEAQYNLVVVLSPDSKTLEEVVMVGYGTTQRKDLTGSVATVDVAEIKDVPFATVDQALTGKAPGVQVIQADGSPGGVAKIRIRGGTSLLGGNDPLYIIDGVQMTVQNRYLEGAEDIISPVEKAGLDNYTNTIGGSFARGLNSLGGLNLNDIESISILKDASATAIYGSKAANGVVIITTKKGKYNQKPIFDVNYYAGVSNPIKEKLLNAEQYTMIMKEAAANLNAARAAANPALPPDERANAIINDPSYLGTADTDWLDLVLRNAITQNADISVRGGGAGSRYYTSLGFNKNNGVVEGTDYTRIAGKVSLDNDITRRLRINTNLNYGFSTNNITNGIYTQALFAPPTFEPYNPDGSVRIIASEELGARANQGFQNPLALLAGVNESNTVTLIGSLAGEYDIIKDLTFRTSLAVNYNTYHQDNYIPSTASSNANGGSSNNGIATQAQSQDVNTFLENTLTWDNQFNANHRLNVVAGTSWQITKNRYFSASGQGFPDDVYLNNLSSAALTLPSEGGERQNSLLSFYMRANYSLFDKYLFTFTGRSDASSKFPKDNRVGYFPSGGVAWRISEENFLKDVSWLDELKVRASMGYTGTQNIADNLFYTLYSPVSYAGINGLAPSQLGNDKIKWESTLQKDAGINFSLFDSRLSGEFGYYEKATTGVLFPTSVAQSSGFDEVTANIANVQNRGLELVLDGDFIRKDDFQWSGTLNISGNRSKVLALSENFSDPNNPSIYGYGNTVLQVGQPLGLLNGRVFDGLLRTQTEVDAYREANYLIALGVWAPYLGIGDPRFVLDEMGLYIEDIVGSAEPKYYGGYTNTLRYKNLILRMSATFSSGGDIFYLADALNQDVSNTTNKGVRILDRWTPENPDSDRPRLLLGESAFANATNKNVYDASYIRLKSVTLSYQLPKLLLNKLRINSASVYASATNLFTKTHYPGADPEVSNDPYSLIGGYSDSAGYPTVRQFSIGFRFGF